MELVNIDKARKWYNQHEDHVDFMTFGYIGVIYEPSGEDISHPELWKAGHWKWFLLYHDEKK